jgi:hypothetical protein
MSFCFDLLKRSSQASTPVNWVSCRRKRGQPSRLRRVSAVDVKSAAGSGWNLEARGPRQ